MNKTKKRKVKKVIKQLKKASNSHLKQSKVLNKLIKKK
tara:strand:+ start:115 stop:228 length:114 start_codon:yes stop_codon:yes gene_type:complete